MQNAREAFRIWSSNPFHPSLHFKKVGGDKWSVRVGLQYRCIGRFEGGKVIWLWIGSHADYDNILS